VELRWTENLTRSTSAKAWRVLLRSLKSVRDGELRLVLADSVELDSAGVGLLEELRNQAVARQVRLLVETKSPGVRNVLSIYSVPPTEATAHPRVAGLFERVGERVVQAADEAFHFLVLTSDMTFLALRGLVRPMVPFRTFVEQSIRIGSQSLPIIALISFLVGLTTALQAAYQLRQFGANIYIANLVGVAMLAEMGPLMTAIVMAGRSGSSIAAEIATMVIAEEVDALKTMGIPPLRYVLLPRLYALLFTQPLLTVMSTAIGILGGLLVGVLYLDLSVPAFWTQLVDGVAFLDLVQALLKSVVFATIIGLTAAHVGFRARGGATGVGKSTTSAVVASIFLVIVADAIFSLIFYFGN
jgi:phospholipid/cholesterol/gamma-HCH transport system permease protein